MKTIRAFDFLKLIATLSGLMTALWLIQRLSLLFLMPAQENAFSIGALITAFTSGLVFDFGTLTYLFIPLVLFFLVSPKILLRGHAFRIWFLILSTVLMFVVIFTITSEYFFYDEFKSRFNFIAVDYLIYTTEVLHNIWESYHVVWIVLGDLLIVLLTLSPLYFLTKNIKFESERPWREKSLVLIVSILLVAQSLLFISESKLLDDQNFTVRETAKNGIFAIFAAFRHNQIDYHQFYVTLDKDKLTHTNAYDRDIHVSETPKKLNVIFVLMESLSAKFMKSYGNDRNLTPNLDRLAHSGLFFNNLYATGTRTVRGIEATTLSLPPTPGQSIVRRPKNENLFNIGTVFQDRGYALQFIYGGISAFDNMGYYFENNGYQVIDETDLSGSEKTFGNAWGVCDEDLFHRVLVEADKKFAEHKPFFQYVLNTSNHRPFTYPSGKIDIPSGDGRSGAVKYSDFAIGEFIEEASKRPWFDNTVFVFIADHNAAVAGGTDINISDYLIPFIIYSPKNIAPKIVSDLASQIDVAPTVIGQLNFSYHSRFFGSDLTREKPNRAFVGTYQKIGYLQNEKMVLLSPGHHVEIFDVKDKKLLKAKSEPSDLTSDPIVKDGISLYQTADFLFSNGLLKVKK